MNEPSKTIDRMVDGELDRVAERKLLLDCEANNRWRELAIAFVESRAWNKDIKQLFVSPDLDAAPLKPTSRSEPRHERWGVWSLAVAVLLSLGLGYGLGWGWQRAALETPDFAANQPAGEPSRESDLPSSMQFMVNHPSTRELQQIEIPLLKATDLGPNWEQRLQANSSSGLIDEMRRQGLNLRQQRTLTPVRLSNGQRVVVPVDYFYEQPYQ